MGHHYDKLIRDRVPEIIRRDGADPVTHVARDDEYHAKLREKLREEVAEFLESGTVEELADILEVVYALALATGTASKTLDSLRARKTRARGAFDKRIILDEIR